MRTLILTIFALFLGFSTYADEYIITQAKTFNLLKTSMTLFEKGEYEKSEKAIDDAILLDSTNPILFAQKNRILLTKSSEDHLRKPIRLNLIDDTDVVRRQADRVNRIRSNRLQSYYPRSMQ